VSWARTALRRGTLSVDRAAGTPEPASPRVRDPRRPVAQANYGGASRRLIERSSAALLLWSNGRAYQLTTVGECPALTPQPSTSSDSSSAPLPEGWLLSDAQRLFDQLIVGAEWMFRVERVEADSESVPWLRLARVALERAASDMSIWSAVLGHPLRLPAGFDAPSGPDASE
jgi:hypothetical protein